MTPKKLVLQKRSGQKHVVGTGLAVDFGDPETLLSRRTVVIDEPPVGLNQIENLRARGPYLDEVQAYLEKKAQAADEVGGDEFYQRVQMQQIDREEIAKIAPYTRQNPPSVVGVALSGQQTVASGGQMATVAVWAGYDEEAISATVAIYPVLPVQQIVAGLGKGAWRPFANVTIGLRGAKQTIAVDVGMGVQFTVAASLIQIDVGMDPVASGSALSSGATLGGHIAFRSVTRQKPVTRTVYVDGLGIGANKTVFLPLFAKDVTPYWSTGAAPTLAYLDIAGNTLYSIVAAQGVKQGDLPGDAVAVKVTDGGGGADVRLVCGLEL